MATKKTTPAADEKTSRRAGASRPSKGTGWVNITPKLQARVKVTARKQAYGHDMFLCTSPQGQGEDWLRGTSITWDTPPTD